MHLLFDFLYSSVAQFTLMTGCLLAVYLVNKIQIKNRTNTTIQ